MIQAIAAAVVAIIAALGGLVSQGGAAANGLSSNTGSDKSTVAPSNPGNTGNNGNYNPGTGTPKPINPGPTTQAFGDSDFRSITTLDGNAVILTGFSDVGRKKLQKNGGLISFPDTINGKPIVEIERDAFRYEHSFKNIYAWPAHLERIGHGAFYGCSRLRRLPLTWQNVNYIGRDAFNWSTKLEKVPASWGKVEKIGRYAFDRTNIEDLPSTEGLEKI